MGKSFNLDCFSCSILDFFYTAISCSFLHCICSTFKTFEICKHHLIIAESLQFKKLISVDQLKPFDKFLIVYIFQTRASEVLNLENAIKLLRMLETTLLCTSVFLVWLCPFLRIRIGYHLV